MKRRCITTTLRFACVVVALASAYIAGAMSVGIMTKRVSKEVELACCVSSCLSANVPRWLTGGLVNLDGLVRRHGDMPGAQEKRATGQLKGSGPIDRAT